MTLFEILVYFIVIVKAFFAPSNAPVRSTGPTPVPSAGATGQAGQAPVYTLSANPKRFAYLRQFMQWGTLSTYKLTEDIPALELKAPGKGVLLTLGGPTSGCSNLHA